MTYIDTHAHLYLDQFDEDRTEIISSFMEAGVDKVFLPNIDLSTIPSMHKLCEEYPSTFYPMMGIHPCSVKKDWSSQFEKCKKHFDKNKHIAIGEIGIDLYWDKTLKEEQMQSFKAHAEWAKQIGLPIVIHCRESFDEIFEVLDEVNDENLKGVFHCFTGNVEQGKKILNYGDFYLGIGGVVTFKNSGLDKTLTEIDINNLVLETDAPYLAPTPKRGKRNESSYIPFIAKKLSSIYSIDETKVGEITSLNAKKIFNIK